MRLSSREEEERAEQQARDQYARRKAEALAMFQLWREGRAPDAFELGMFYESLRREPERKELEGYREQRRASGDKETREAVTAGDVLTALFDAEAEFRARGRATSITGLIREVADTSEARFKTKVSRSTVGRRYQEALERFVPFYLRSFQRWEATEGSTAAAQKAARIRVTREKGLPPGPSDVEGWELLKRLHHATWARIPGFVSGPDSVPNYAKRGESKRKSRSAA